LESRCSSSEECLSLTYSFKFNLQRQPSNCNSSSTQARSKNNKMTRTSNLKGSRNLQSFKGGIVSGIASGGGTGTTSGSVSPATPYDNEAVVDSVGKAGFTATSGSNGAIDTNFGTAAGSSAAGATGSQDGSLGTVMGGEGILTFDGTLESSGQGSFGGGISPVQFNAVVREVPGEAYEGKSGSPKSGGSSGGGVSPSTFVTTFVPVSTGPTGGFGAGSGSLDIDLTTQGNLMSSPEEEIGTALFTGEATNFGGGSASAQNLFGSAGGLGSGASTGAAIAAGIAAEEDESANFIGTGGAESNFINQGSGIFGGSNGVLSFP
jgi:hypothetical protein